MAGCTLEDCLKLFTAAEQVQNYRCSHCWHIAAVKYLLSMGGNEAAVEKIECCTEEDSCDCQRLFHLETLPWSNRFSRTLKQISIARCPKILCIHLKRVSVNVFGEFVKLRSGEKNWKTGRVQLQSENPSPQPNHFNLEYDPRRLNFVQGLARGCTYQELNTSCDSVPLDTCLYRLVAVVEHFGRAGSGHYTVYRSVWADLCEEQLGDQFDASTARWFSISDAEWPQPPQPDQPPPQDPPNGNDDELDFEIFRRQMD
ncbi:hypothetical protein ACLB2K_004200 [Fragaria x ananassa]